MHLLYTVRAGTTVVGGVVLGSGGKGSGRGRFRRVCCTTHGEPFDGSGAVLVRSGFSLLRGVPKFGFWIYRWGP